MFSGDLDQFFACAKNLANRAAHLSLCDKSYLLASAPWLREATILLWLLTGSLSRSDARRLRAILRTRPE